MELWRGCCCGYWGGLLHDDGACVEARFHFHEAYACFAVAFPDGALDGGSASPAGEEGGVDIDAAEARGV